MLEHFVNRYTYYDRFSPDSPDQMREAASHTHDMGVGNTFSQRNIHAMSVAE